MIDCVLSYVSACCVCSDELPKNVPSVQTLESDEDQAEPLTVIEQPEVITPQPTANQAMKGTVVLLILFGDNKMQVFVKV